jgi:hypothetical protein
MKSRSFFTALAIAVVILLSIGAGGAYWLAAGRPVHQVMPEAAMFVSARSPLIVTLLGNPDRLTASAFALTPPLQRRSLQAEVKGIQATFLTDTHLDYARDIQPWAGDEITWALTAADVDRDGSNGQQPGYLAAIAIRDPEAARQALDKYWQKRVTRGAKLVFEQFASVPIVREPSGLASARVGDRFVLFANDAKVLREAINSAQVTDSSLQSHKAYREAIDRLPADALGFAFANFPGKNGVDHLAMTLKLAPQGILADTILLTPDAKSSRPTLTAPVDALKWIPGNSLVTVGGKDVQRAWVPLEARLTDYGLAAPIEAVQAEWGVDLDQEVLSWMSGDYALGMLPGSGKSDWVFVTKQTPETTAGLERLNAIAQTRGVSIGTVPLGDAQITAWTKLQTTPTNRSTLMSIEAKVEGVHTALDGYEIFATSLEAMELTIQRTAQKDWSAAIAHLESRNNGYLWVEGTALRSTLSKLVVSRSIVPRVKPLLDRVESVTVSNYGGDSKGLKNGAFVQFKPESPQSD